MWQLSRLYVLRMLGRPGLLIFLLCLPVALCWLEYAVFRASSVAPQVLLAVVDEENSAASKRLVSCLTYGVGGEDLLVSRVDGWAAAWSMYEAGRVSAVVSIPLGYASAVGAHTSPHAGFIGTEDAVGTLAARSALAACVLREQSGKGLSRLGEPAPVVVQRSGAAPTASEQTRSFVGTHFPGLVVFALLFAAQSLAAPLFRDREGGVERRLVMNNAGPAIRTGAALCYLAGCLTVFAWLLLLPSSLIFGQPVVTLPPMALAAIGMAIFAALLQLLVLAVALTPRAAVALSSMIGLLLALAGGSFLPLSLYPASLRASLGWLPNAAAQDVMQHALGGAPFAANAWLPLLAWMLVLAAAVAILGAMKRGRHNA